MSNLTNALVVVLCINVMFFLGQASVNGVAAEIGLANTSFYTGSGGMIEQWDAGGNILSDDNSTILPQGSTGSGGVSPDEGNSFTDMFSTAYNWIIDKLGIGYIIAILRAPYNFLQAIGLPQAYVFGIGSLWYGLTLFLIVSWLIGRDA